MLTVEWRPLYPTYNVNLSTGVFSMADGQTMDEQALQAPSYQPPLQTVSNQDQSARDNEKLAARLAALEAQLAATEAANAPKPEPTPEETARAALDRGGAGLGVEERLAELYRHVGTIALKVGI